MKIVTGRQVIETQSGDNPRTKDTSGRARVAFGTTPLVGKGELDPQDSRHGTCLLSKSVINSEIGHTFVYLYLNYHPWVNIIS